MVDRKPSQNRSTYIMTDEYDMDEILEAVEAIKLKEPTCERVLIALEKNPKLSEAPQLNEMYAGANNKELVKLLQTCLQPEVLGVHNPSWPLLSRNLLMEEPPVLLEEALKHAAIGRYLFEFLQHHPNDTARGYFSELLHFTENDFQDKLLSFLTKNQECLQLCLSHCHYPQVYSFLFQMVVYCDDTHKEFALLVLQALLDRMSEPKHKCELAENLLSSIQKICSNFDKLLSGGVKEDEAEPLRLYCIRVFALVSKCWTKEYSDKLIDMCLENWRHDERLGEALLEVLSESVKIYNHIPRFTEEIGVPFVDPLRECIVGVLRKMHLLTDILKQEPEQKLRNSTGEEIRCVGMLRFKMLELLEVILRLDPNLVSQHYNLKQNGVLKILQKYITMNPWNNQVHILIESILTSLINSFDRYSELEDNYTGVDGFLAFLIETFRSHDFIFLASASISNYGYIHSLYKIARAVIIKLDQSKILKAIMSQFKPWEEFVLDDLQKYESMMDVDLGGEPPSVLTEKKRNKSESQSIRRIVVDLSRKEVSEVSDQEEDINQDINDHFFQVDMLAGWPGAQRPERTQHRRNTIGSELPRFDEVALQKARGYASLKKTNSQATELVHAFSEDIRMEDSAPVIVEHKVQTNPKQLQTIIEEDQLLEAVLNMALDKKISIQSAATETPATQANSTKLRRGFSEQTSIASKAKEP